MKLLYGFGLCIFSALVIGCTDSDENTYTIDRQAYLTQMEGFWLGQCIANWTGLITEMDKIGLPIEGKGGWVLHP